MAAWSNGALLACGCCVVFVVVGGEASTALSMPGRLGLCFLNGEPTASEAPLVLNELPPRGGVPAVPAVELRDCGVPAEGVSEVYM